MKVRLETEYKEAWVYKGSLGMPIAESPVTETKPEPIKEPQPQEPVVTEQPKDTTATVPVTKEPIKEPVVTETPKVDSVATKPVVKPTGKPFFFKLTSNETGEPLVGEIHVFDANSQNFQIFPANQVVYLNAPKDPSQVYRIATLSAGYQEMDRAVNYADPAASSAELGNSSEFVIALPLVHVKMGDYIEFSNVTFFQNSVMLHPESKEELDGLAELLKQNPRYKINVHAHCNGTQERNIIVRANNNEFFGTSSGNQRKTVSAKALTDLRAEVVKDYLVSQGVEAKRIQTKGEGGAALIYPVNSILANRNDRVEVEVKRGK
jgi:outer membrane protein OmpA-like peptidoglycan-associated protein